MRGLLLLFLLVSCGRGPVEELPVDVASLPTEERFLAEIDRTRGVRDCFLPIRDAPLVPAADAPRMRPDEVVLGLDLGKVQVAYPTLYLNHAEIVEHTVLGQELLVCW